jgi:integral membrane sensor domain MASE1
LEIKKHQTEAAMTLRAKLKKLDLVGILAIMGAVCCLLLALQLGQETGHWGKSSVVGCLVAAFFLTIAFGVVQ